MLLILTKISVILTAIFAFGMGVYTLYKNPKAKVNQIWFLNNLVVMIWAISGCIIMMTSSYATGILGVKISFIGVTLAVLFFHFVTTFLFQEKRHKLKIIIGYIVLALIIILIAFSKLFLKDINYLNGFGYYALPGLLFNYVVVFFSIYVVYTFYLLFKAYKVADGIKKKQIYYLILGLGIGFLGASTGFLINIFEVFPYGWLLVPFYPILISYGMFLKKY
ncbi:hypothetical protein KKA15_00150 [Patescibacteria group bacterium]|nr:hypothetical protein [Patescibacteria group bacterium]